MDPSRFTVHGTKSTLVYKPHPNTHSLEHNHGHGHISEQEQQNQMYGRSNTELYGMVYCKANNSFGNQEEPCIFVISPAGKVDFFSVDYKN